ncbi:acyltransferase [Methylomonas paludis]|uniref:Acyltransferase n=1 Tax=Methylomonas paludis TaxID=1173101 RepID=A0A975RAV9_9GAMM|nr:acyltransferase [Methylomonas paludis]QWF71646.1 acyltransferase [Methylomonas paludis]
MNKSISSAIPATNTPRKSEFHIPSLDGIRTVAILLVFVSHTAYGHYVPGGLGVTIFFFLSGYLITTLLRKEYIKNNSIDIRHFYLRRFFRIWPNFYFVLLITTVLTIYKILPGDIQLMPFLAQILHYTNYYTAFYGPGGTAIGTGSYWSLAVEEHYYLLFPFIYISMLKLNLSAKVQALVFLFICLVILAWRYYLVNYVGVDMLRTYTTSDTRFDSLLFGCILAVYKNPVLDDISRHDFKLKYILLPLGILLLIVSLVFRGESFRETFRYTLQCIALFPIFISAIRFYDWGFFKLLNYKAVSFFGVLSYSFYLEHYAILGYFKHETNLPPYLAAVLGFGLAWLLAYLMHIGIEKPFNRLRKRFI